jgi:hypothetical protein
MLTQQHIFMNKLYQKLAVLLLFVSTLDKLSAQVTVTGNTNTTPALAATYTSLANAITALNTITAISAPVTITLTAGNNQTAPAGGYVINFTATTNAARTVTITGSGNTITANSSLTPGSLTDGIFKLVGVDFVTINNFTLRESPANTMTAAATNNMTEWGVALLYASPANGAQNNTIQNNTITLNKTYANTFGIYSNTRHTATVVNTATEVTSTAGANSFNKIYNNAISNVNMGIAFIGSGDAAFMDLSNDIGGAATETGNMITNWGGQEAASIYIGNSGTCYGIFINNQKNEIAAFNSITSAVVTTAGLTMRGVFKNYNIAPTGTFSSNIASNTIAIRHGGTSGTLECIRSEGISAPLATASILINNNLLRQSDISGINSSITFTGITNTSQCGLLNINQNQFHQNLSSATSGGFTGISNTGNVQTEISIIGNRFGRNLSVADAPIIFTEATSGSIVGINCPTMAPAAFITIASNDFYTFRQANAGTGSHTYISYVHSPNTATTDLVSSNDFFAIQANTSGNVSFIVRSGIMALGAGATAACINNNMSLSKPIAGGTVAFITGTSGSLGGNFIFESTNSIGSVSVTGATTVTGIRDEEGGLSGPQKTIVFNSFGSWSCGTGAVTLIRSDFGDNNSTINNNTIQSIDGSGAITGISIGVNNKGAVQHCSSNTIRGLTSTTGNVLGIFGGSASVTTLNIDKNSVHDLSSGVSGSFAAIRMFTAATTNIFKNKIYNISGTSTGSLVNGIDVQSAALGTYNIHNNLIGNLTANTTSSLTAIRGISLLAVNAGNNYNVFYNSVYINASSSGANFGTAAFSTNTSATAANGALRLRNNIFVNTSTAAGAGLSMAYRRSSIDLANFGNSSNNNIYYAGTPSASNVIFSDGTNSDQTLAAYKTRVGATRDAASFTEMPPFLSTVGSDANFLHLNPNASTQAESGAVNIATYTTDFDDNIRRGNAGYTGVGTAPDIGADEIANEVLPPSITYTPISSPICFFSGMTIYGVVIKDSTGVPLSGALVPRIYYRKNAGTWFSSAGILTGGVAKNSTWKFTINETSMGGVFDGDVVSYYIIAQDIMPAPNIGASPGTGLVATNVNTVTAAPNTLNAYTITGSLNGLYTIGVGGNFTTLDDAITAYNNVCSLQGPVIFELAESFIVSVSINDHPDASATKTLTIRQATGSGANISDIVLNGAKYVTIDGREGGAGSVKSMETASVLLQNDAKFCTVKYCKIYFGVSFGAASATGTGNNYNLIDNNNIEGFMIIPCISANGTATFGKRNKANVISNNNISNFSDAGISLSYFDSVIITGNRLFQPQELYYVAASEKRFYGITLNDNCFSSTIINNVIGFANEAGTGTTVMIGNSTALTGFPDAYTPGGTATPLSYTAIYADANLEYGSGGGGIIKNNIIGGIALYTSGKTFANTVIENLFTGISFVGWGSLISIDSNIIGSATQNNSIYIAAASSGGKFKGIKRGFHYLAWDNMSDNVIGGITASGTSNTTGVSITGIEILNTNGPTSVLILKNRIGNSNAANIKTGLLQSGGLLSRTGTLLPTTGIANIIGINAPDGSTVKENILQGWEVAGASAEVTGIRNYRCNDNILGTATTPWVNYAATSTGKLTGIEGLFASNNQLSGITYSGAVAGTGAYNLIYLNNISSSSDISYKISADSNTFKNLFLRSPDINLIKTNVKLTSAGKIQIKGNAIETGLLVTAPNGELSMIQSQNDNAAGSVIEVRDNNFSNVSINSGATHNSSGILIYETNAAANGYAVKKIMGNTISNWLANSGSQTGMSIGTFGSVAASANPEDSVSNNIVSNLSTGEGSINGIAMANPDPVNIVRLSDNVISGISSASVIDGILSTGIIMQNNYAPSKIYVERNTVHTINVSGVKSISYGILAMQNNQRIEMSANKVYDISAVNTDALAIGIGVGFADRFGTVLGDNNNSISLYNNMVGDINAPFSGNVTIPSVKAIDIVAGSSISVIHNTVHLDASSTNPLFSSAAVYTHTNPFTTNIILSHNLFNNLSIPGSSGKTVTHWRESNSFTNLSNSTDYNSYYAGIPAANRLLYFDGTNSSQTLANYKTALSPRENNAVNEIPLFLSTSGVSADYLHLNPIGNCGLIQRVQSGALVSRDFDGDVRYTFPLMVDIGADEVAKRNIWTGTNGTAWSNPLNWSTGTVPNGIDRRVSIPVTLNQPVIAAGETFQVNDIIINSGATLSNIGTLKIAGLYSSVPAGAINNINAGIVTGSVEMNNICSTQTLNGNIFTNNAVKNFKVTNDFTVSSTTGEGLNISGELGFDAASSNKTFNSGNNVVLVSTANATANVASTINNNTYTGQFTVERFIPARRSWRLLTAPLSSTATTTISQAWQDGQQATTIPPPAYTAGSGTLITNGTIATNGFDKGSTNNPSIKLYNGLAWVPPANTNVLPIKTHPGYMLFVRGDRNISIAGIGVVANATTLRPKNSINVGTQIINNLVGTGFQIVGNPFASAINFHTITKTGLSDIYHLWDPRIGGISGVGGFVTFAWNSINNNYDRTVSGAGSSTLPKDGTIESGAAFVVNFTGTGNLQIKETDKTNTSAAAPFGRPALPSVAEGRLQVNLGFKEADSNFALLDGLLVTFHSSYNDAITVDDAEKFSNINENIAVDKKGHLIAIERRHPVERNDTVLLAISQYKLRTYQLQLIPQNIAVAGLSAFVSDSFTNTLTEVSTTDTSYYSFATNNDNPLSYAKGRLKLIFKTSAVPHQQSSFLQVTAAAQNRNIAINWKVSLDNFTAHYIVEKSVNGADFAVVSTLVSSGSSAYHWLDTKPVQGNNYYRIKKIGTNGEVEYGNTVSIRIDKTEHWIHIYPNPVTAGNCTVQINNETAGTYTLRLLTNVGQIIYTSTIHHPGGQRSHALKMPGNIADGEYHVELTCVTNGHTSVIPLLIKNK